MKRIIFFIAILAAILTGCEKEYRYYYEAWINHDIEGCDTADPMVNNPWLSAQHKANMESTVVTASDVSSDFIRYALYQNDTSGNYAIVENSTSTKEQFRIAWFSAYDCDGNELVSGGDYNHQMPDLHKTSVQAAPANGSAQVPPKPCYGCEEFFEHHTFVAYLAEYTLKKE